MTDTTAPPTTPEPDPRQLSMFDGAVAKFAPDLLEQHLAGELVEKRPERDQVVAEAPAKAMAQPEVIQFPFWPDTDRAAPNAFLRSALFGLNSNKGT